MRPAHVIEIVTPKKVRLNGLLFGTSKPKRVVILVHGFSSSVFGKQVLAEKLSDKATSVVVFNNRGHDVISNITRGKSTRFLGGAAHEIFTECVDDIDGALTFAAGLGAKEIFVGGSSTGCQKSVYWRTHTRHPKRALVKGLILLAPVSDRAAYDKEMGEATVRRAIAKARALVKNGKANDLLPSSVFPLTLDAQRTLSLLELSSDEEIFTYTQPEVTPQTFQSVRVPMMVVWARNDEYNAHPIDTIRRWFEAHARAPLGFAVVRAKHSFKGVEREVANLLTKFMKDPYS